MGEWQALIIFLLTVLTGVSGWALLLIISVDKKLSVVETWKQGHEALDNERHERLDNEVKEIKQALRASHGKSDGG
jgi:hypothetical protein